MSRLYSKQEVAVIEKYYPMYGATGKSGCVEMLSKIGSKRDAGGVTQKARKLGLRYFGCKKGSFKKGHKPHNKGKKMSPDTYKKCSATMFKKGRVPHNAKFDGYLSYREHKKGSYWYIRVASGVSVPLHRCIYESYYGVKIKKGQNVRFKDGDSNNFSIDNLQLISRTMNLLKNNPKTKHLPLDLLQAIEYISNIKKVIKDYEEQTIGLE